MRAQHLSRPPCLRVGTLLLAISSCVLAPQVSALYPFKLIHNISHEITLTPDEWSSEFRCTLANAGELEQNGSLPLECLRDENYWIYKHIDEIHDQFKLLVQQDSLDERLADKIYMVNSHTGLDYHHYKFNTGNRARDKALEKHVAGSQVNDKLCKVHLKQMVALLDDLSGRVHRKRLNDTTAPDFVHTTRLDERHFRLARVLDSFGRYESGELAGRYHSFGAYHECVRTPMLLAHGEGLVNSRYCWARLGLDEQLSAPLRAGRGILNGTMPWGDFGFHLATCLPATCHSKSFSGDLENLRLVQQLVDSQYEMPDSMYVNQTLQVESIFCLVDLDSPVARMPPSGILFVTFLLSWCALCAFATYWRRDKHNLLSEPGTPVVAQQSKQRNKSFWSHLDLWDSLQEFLGERDVKREGALVDLDSLNFIKCWCTLFVMISHACLVTSPMSFTQLSMQAFMETGRLESFLVLGFALVDTFFVISSLVVTFVMLKRFARIEANRRQRALANQMLPATVPSKQQKLADLVQFEREWYTPWGGGFYKSWLQMTWARYLRLVPLFLLAFWFKKGLFIWLGSGPMWDYGLNRNTNVGGCQQESWLTPFTALSAYAPATRQCLPQSWSISNDIALSLFVPPLTILLFKRTRMAYLYALAAYALAMFFGFSLYYQLDARLRFMLEQGRNHSVIVLFQMASHAYSSPCYRVPSVLCGALAGRALFKWEQRRQRGGQDKSTCAWPWAIRWVATPLGFGFIGFVIASSFFAAEVRVSTTEQTRGYVRFYMLALHHTLWSLANAIVLLRMVSDWREQATMRLFASRFFKVASKLSYAFLLLHLDILFFDALIEPQTTEYSRWNYFKSLGTTMVYSILLAVPVHVILEHPLDKLTKTYLLRT